MNDRCCGISKHIHLGEGVDALLEDSWPLFGDETDENPEKKENLNSSDALSDQVLSLNTYC